MMRLLAVQSDVPRVIFIGDLCFDPTSGELRRGTSVRRLEPQPAALLTLLASRPGELVTYAEIVRHIWPEGTHVDFQDGVHYAVRHLRAALGDRARDPRFVETVPRRGYRLRADAVTRPVAPDVNATVARARAPLRRRALVAGALVLLLAAVVIIERRPNDHHARAVALLSALHDLAY
jgi:DNA-binding winged helix-turn-helix (wHTH) protein